MKWTSRFRSTALVALLALCVVGSPLLTLNASAQRREVVGNLTWTAGSGAPSSTAEPSGSLYSRTDTLDLYMYDGAAWRIKAVAGLSYGYKAARGQATTVAASDTIVSGLATVVAVVCVLDSDPTDDPEWVSCSIGDQAGTPAAGSFLLKSWKNTSGTDPTPAAASTYTKKVNWIAIGT